MGLITPVLKGKSSATINGTSSSDYVDLVKDSDGFPLLRIYGDGTIATKAARIEKL